MRFMGLRGADLCVLYATQPGLSDFKPLIFRHFAAIGRRSSPLLLRAHPTAGDGSRFSLRRQKVERVCRMPGNFRSFLRKNCS